MDVEKGPTIDFSKIGKESGESSVESKEGEIKEILNKCSYDSRDSRDKETLKFLKNYRSSGSQIDDMTDNFRIFAKHVLEKAESDNPLLLKDDNPERSKYDYYLPRILKDSVDWSKDHNAKKIDSRKDCDYAAWQRMSAFCRGLAKGNINDDSLKDYISERFKGDTKMFIREDLKIMTAWRKKYKSNEDVTKSLDEIMKDNGNFVFNEDKEIYRSV